MANRMYSKGKKLAPEIEQEIKERYEKGEKYETIIYEMKISRSTLNNIIYRLGLLLRRPDLSKRGKRGPNGVNRKVSKMQGRNNQNRSVHQF